MNTLLPIQIQQDKPGSLILSSDQATLHVVQQHYENLTFESSPVAVSSSNPYRGVAPFREQNYSDFFGREHLVQKLLKKLAIISQPPTEGQRVTRLLPLIGASGSGKTSILRAGLLPALVQQPLSQLRSAHALLFTPNRQPLYNLALMLARLVTQDPYPISKTGEFQALLEDSNGLREIIAQLPYHNRTLLLIIDDFDEVYHPAARPEKLDLFTENLLRAITDPNLQVFVILALCPESLAATQRHPLLNRAITQHATLVPALSLAELHRVVTVPAHTAGHPFNDQIINRLLDQLPAMQQSLPLLQLTMTQLWKGMSQSVKAEQTLEQLNGIAGAVHQTAQNIYCSLVEDEQQLLQRIFLQLIQPQVGFRYRCIAIKLTTLATLVDSDGDTLLRVLAPFTRSEVNFLTLLQGEDDLVLSITNNTLVYEWHTLQTWLTEREQCLALQQQFREAAQCWQQQRRPEQLLWRSPQLDAVGTWYRQSQQSMSAIQSNFFRTAQRRQQQVRWLKRLAAIGLVLLTLVSWVSAYWANQTVSQSQQAHASVLQAYQHHLQILEQKDALLAEARAQQRLLQEELSNARSAAQQAVAIEQQALHTMDIAVAEWLEQKQLVDKQQQQITELQTDQLTDEKPPVQQQAKPKAKMPSSNAPIKAPIDTYPISVTNHNKHSLF